MPNLHLIQFCCVTIFVFSTFCFCSNISICSQTPFTELCNSIIDVGFGSHKSRIRVSMSQAQDALKHVLARSQSTLDAQTNTTLMDCLKLYIDVINHINRSTTHMNPTDVEKWVEATTVNHSACLTGFKNSNISGLFVDLLAKNRHVANNFYMTRNDRAIQLAKRGATKANLVVAKDGSGDFNTITKAIEASEKKRIGIRRFIIYVKAGIYKENIIIKKSMINLMLIGDGIDATIITNNKSVYEGIPTNNTATVQVWGSAFVAVGITFENTAGPEKQQAIALLSASHLSVFYKCSFKGYQDTLCLLENSQFYRECDIYGTIDFIFGDASAVLQKCNIYVRKPLHGQENTITAQGRTNSRSNTGFVIHNSRVMPTHDLALTKGSVMTFLGRPWRDYSRVVYIKCYLDILIYPAGWLPYMGKSAFDKVYYAEYMNQGKGANTRGRVKWHGYHVLSNSVEAEQFSVRNFLHGMTWIPRTRVPFESHI
ncbi:putative pectinesterase [Helianthus annuus]|nr:putative pectinesterase [Helianthus annuus]